LNVTRALDRDAQVTLFGKTFQLVDANESTRQHISQTFGVSPGPALPYPSDAYTAYYTAKMQRETGADPTISRCDPTPFP
jgi:hypothetical protein